MLERRFIALFYTRLLVYLTAFLLPVVHPAIVVSYDATTWWLWFLFVPLQMHLAFYARPLRLGTGKAMLVAALLAAISVGAITGIDRAALMFLGAQAAGFSLTLALFRSRKAGRFTGVAEIVILSVLLIRMLGFARASETFAEASSSITQAILAIALVAVLLHALVVYLVNFGEGVRRRTLREVALYITGAAILGVVVALVLPPDFVNHNVVLNELREPPQPEPYPLDERTDGLEGGNLRSDRSSEEDGQNGDGRQDGNGESGANDSQRSGQLEGIPADQWENRGRGQSEGQSQGNQGNQGQSDGSGEGENKQYAIMVVGSSRDNIYAADSYYSRFDPQQGFSRDRDEPLNRLAYTRLIETWRNPSPAFDPLREDNDVFFLSTISERVLPYDPMAIEPTVLNTRYHPFDFAYSVTAGISDSTPREWRRIAPLSGSERLEYSEYLDVELDAETGAGIEALAESLFAGRSGYYERIEAILGHFTTYQYQIGFTDDVSVGAVSRFLFETKNGDCTEFSNSTALLARLAGVPSRVVTGYLASDGLQSDQHRQGISVLQQSIPPLAEFDADDLYLVTSAHRHSWVQVIMPGYGWVDLETTATAIPPMGSMDPNAMDVVIPIITSEEIINRNFEFPWLLVGQALLILGVTGLGAAYVFRYGRRLYLRSISRGTSRRSLQALYSLLLGHMASEGYPTKPESDTSVEYAGRHPEAHTFAERYTRLRYRTEIDPSERSTSWSDIRATYRDAKRATRRGGIVGLIKRIVSLRELRY